MLWYNFTSLVRPATVSHPHIMLLSMKLHFYIFLVGPATVQLPHFMLLSMKLHFSPKLSVVAFLKIRQNLLYPSMRQNL